MKRMTVHGIGGATLDDSRSTSLYSAFEKTKRAALSRQSKINNSHKNTGFLLLGRTFCSGNTANIVQRPKKIQPIPTVYS